MNEKVLNYSLLALKVIIGVLGFVIPVVIIMGEKEVGEEKLHNLGAIEAGVILSFVAFGLCILIWMIFGIWNIVTNLRKSIPLLISIIIFGIIFAISYSLSTDEIMETWKKKPELFTPGNIKWSDVGIYSMYGFLLLTILTIVYSEISKLFK